MRRPRFALFSALLAVMLLVPAAIPRLTSAQEAIEFRVWDQFTGPDSEVVDQLYATFMEQHPGVTVVREVVDFQPMQQTINTALASGTGPDAVYYGTGPAYAGVLAPAEGVPADARQWRAEDHSAHHIGVRASGGVRDSAADVIGRDHHGPER